MSESLVRQSRKDRVDYKKLNDGNALSLRFRKSKIFVKPNVLPQSYSVERIIVKKKSSEGEIYLVKWDGYHMQESTWEPASHISDDLLDSYLHPLVCRARLQAAAVTFETAIQQCLSSKANVVSVTFPLDIFRYVFGSDQSVVLNSRDEVQRLPLSENWTYKINCTGRGVMVLFPIRVTPRCFMRPVYIQNSTTGISKKTMPVEKMTLVCPVQPFNQG